MADTKDTTRVFRSLVLEWMAVHGRHFPWRDSRDPYLVLIAEMMLRRTRAEQVVPVYEEFVRQFPTVQSLSTASETEVASVLRPLGLAWRVPAFRQMAQQIVNDFDGSVPEDRDALLSLPGVGEYVADAVRCLAFGQPLALVDVNTVRVAGRYLGFEFNQESRRNPAVRQAVASLVDPEAARESNLALLDFAAMVCRAVRPLHDRCPVAAWCAYVRSKPHGHEEETNSGAN